MNSSDGVDFVNDFLSQLVEDGTWAELWQVTLGDRTGISEAPESPVIGAEAAEAEVMELLRRVGVGDQAHKVPAHLSGGQQQRVAIARALAMVIVTHEMAFARAIADRVIFLEDGRIVEESTDPKAFFDHPATERARLFLRALEH